MLSIVSNENARATHISDAIATAWHLANSVVANREIMNKVSWRGTNLRVGLNRGFSSGWSKRFLTESLCKGQTY